MISDTVLHAAFAKHPLRDEPYWVVFNQQWTMAGTPRLTKDQVLQKFCANFGLPRTGAVVTHEGVFTMTQLARLYDYERAADKPDHGFEKEGAKVPYEEKVLILTVGLPRAGKSTWAKAQGCPVVNPDSVRLAMHGQAFRKESEPLVWGVVATMVRSLFIAGHGRVILDATNVTAATRAQWKSGDWRTMVKVFDRPGNPSMTMADVCVERCHDCGTPDLIPVIHRMSQAWEYPGEFSKYEG